MIRVPLIFHAGGECLPRYGSLVRQTRPGEASLAHTRTGTTAKHLARDGVIRGVDANIPAIEWLDLDGDGLLDTPIFLTQNERINVQDEDDLNDGIDWIPAGAAITPGIDDPLGGTGAFTIADDNNAAVESLSRTISFTGDGVKAFLIALRERSHATTTQFELTGDASTRMLISLTGYVSGRPTLVTGIGEVLGVRPWANGYWIAAMRSTAVTASQTNALRIYPAAGTASHVASLDIFRVNAFNADEPYLSILNESETRGADQASVPFPAPRVAMTGLIEYIDGVSDAPSAFHRLAEIANAAGTSPQVEIGKAATTGVLTISHASSLTAVSSTVDINSAWGDRVRCRWAIYDDGSAQIWASKDSGSGFGAELEGTRSGALSMTEPFSRPTFYHITRSADSGFGHISHKVALGSNWTTEEMVAA